MIPLILVLICCSLFASNLPVSAGQVVLTWDPTTTNTDGTPLTDLAGFKIYYGTSSGAYGASQDVGTIPTSYTVANLPENVMYYFAVTAYNATGNESAFSNEVFKVIPDATPPVISVVTTASLTSMGATLTWTTDEASTSQVEYGSPLVYGSSTTLDNTPVTSHSVTLSGLSAWTTYHFRVKSQDAAGNLQTSADFTFGTLAPPDMTSPTGTISINGGNVYATTGMVTLTLSCNDSGSGCSSMQFSNDGVIFSIWEGFSAGKTWALNSGNGNKTVYVHYRDMSGNVSPNYSKTITLDATAPVLSSISAGSLTDAKATITWTTDETATTQVDYGTSPALGSSSPIDTTPVINHLVVITGLTPNTTYHYKVRSSDGAGNSAISTEQIFVTLQTPQPDQPAAITNLQVRPGASSRNSVVLEWTATGSDGTVGTASGYDLRMSQLKIIGDGATPNPGEITFSKAASVTGLPVPQAAGTLQSVPIGNLETNSVYYFAIQAIDNLGNLSSLSNVVNGRSLPPFPVTAVRQKYTMISFPLVPATSDTQTLLGSLVGTPVELYAWNSSGAFVNETNVVPGYGYFLRTDKTDAVLNITGTPVTNPNRAIPIQTGWNMIGNPYPAEVALLNTTVKNIGTGEVLTFAAAVSAGWVGNAVYNFNGSTYDFVGFNEAVLKLWQGYWLAVSGDGSYELIITKP